MIHNFETAYSQSFDSGFKYGTMPYIYIFCYKLKKHAAQRPLLVMRHELCDIKIIKV